MLQELSKYEHLGTPEFFELLLRLIATQPDEWNRIALEQYYNGRIIGGSFIFDGCIELALACDIIKVNEDGFFSVSNDVSIASLSNSTYIEAKTLEHIIQAMTRDELFFTLFNSEFLSYDIVHRTIQISNSAFGFKYSKIKQLLLDFGFISRHPDINFTSYVINPKYKKMFDKLLLPEVKRRKVGIEEFEKSLAQKQMYGDLAEEFVVHFEQIRLTGHNKINQVERISLYDVAAGYDVVSFNGLESAAADRFIEVKSFARTPSFYWSRNEIEQSRLKRSSYYLYLVDREKVGDPYYVPIIIQDPFLNVHSSSEWSKTPHVTFVSKL